MSNVTRVFIDGSNKGSPENNRDNFQNRNYSSSSHHVERKYFNTSQEWNPHNTNSVSANTSHVSPEMYYYGSSDRSPRDGYTTQVPINSFMGLQITPSKSSDCYQNQTSTFTNTNTNSVNINYTDGNYDQRHNKDNYSKPIREPSFSPTYRNVNVNAGAILTNPLCIRCSKTVYPAERIEPAKQRVFHTACFKCVECGVKLTIKTYYQNLRNKNDNEVYCKSHQPQLSAAKIDASAKSIQALSNIPKLSTVNEQIRGPGTIPRQTKIDASAYDSYSPQQEMQRNEMHSTLERNYSDSCNSGTWSSRQRQEESFNVARSIPIEREPDDREIRSTRYDSPIRYDSPSKHTYDSPTFSSTPDYGIGSPVTNSYGFNPKSNYRSDFSPDSHQGSPPKSGYNTSPQHPSYRVPYGSSPKSRYDSPPGANYYSPPKANYNSPPRANFGSPPRANFGSPPTANYNSQRSRYESQTKSGTVSPPNPKYGSPPKSRDGYSSKSNYSQQHYSSQNYSHKANYEQSPPRHDSGSKTWMNHI